MLRRGSPRRASPRRRRALDYATGSSSAALATAGGLGFVGFGLEARSGERALLECMPYCSGASIGEVKRNYVLANVSLGTGVLALGGATIWWFGLRRSSPTPSGMLLRPALEGQGMAPPSQLARGWDVVDARLEPMTYSSTTRS
jgi:hypothetical protein